MNSMLDDDVLTRLLGDAADSFPEPRPMPTLTTPERSPLPWKKLAFTAAGVAAAVALFSSGGGVTGQASHSTASDKSAPAPLAPAGGVAGGGSTGGTTGGTTGGQTDGVTRASTAAGLTNLPALGPTVTSQHAPAPAANPPVTGTDPAFADGARIIKTGSIDLVVEKGKVSTVVVKVHGLATSAGGYVSTEKSEEFGDNPSSTVTIRVPVRTFETVLNQVRATVGKGVGKVESASSSGQDVTAQYADVQAQIQSLKAARDRFLVILGRANTIGETLSVQQRVDSVQAQIDQLEGQRRVLAKQSEMATLTVTVSEKAKVVHTQVQGGFSKAWDRATHGFTSSLQGIIARSGKGVVVLMVLVLGLVVARPAWRLARRRLV